MALAQTKVLTCAAGAIEHGSYRLHRRLGCRYHRAIGRLIKRSPYKAFNDRYQAVFVHVPKAAGTSVAQALFGTQPGHTTAEYYRFYDADRFERYFKFAFVRNPWDRLVSAFFYLKQGFGTPADRYIAERHLGDLKSFPEFVARLEGLERSHPLRDWFHLRPQTDFVCDREGRVLVDFVGRFERIEKDFAAVCDRLAIDAALQESNKSARTGYREYYDDSLISAVGRLYQSDVETFGYSFAQTERS